MVSEIHHQLRKSQKLSRKIKREIWHSFLWFRSLTGWCRMLPSFIIVGTQKGGSTSLYNYLIEHPQISPAIEKELRFFDYKYHKGLNWYRGHFPLVVSRKIHKLFQEESLITGEASPNYMFDPRSPKRIANVLPNVKLIFLLRNPIDRAYSSYQMAARRGRERLTFKEAIFAEQSRIEKDESIIMENNRYVDLDRHWFGYLARGRYIEQIKPWLNLFPKNQILFIKSEDFFLSPTSITKKVSSFLNVEEFSPTDYRVYNDGGEYPDMDLETRIILRKYFAPYNSQLFEVIKFDYNWE